MMSASPAGADPEQQQASVVEPRPPSEPLAPVPAPAPATEPERTAADVAGYPVPGFEAGRSDPVDTGDSTLRVVGRGLLFVPRIAFDVVLAPFRFAVWANDRYHPVDWYRRIFYNDAETIGLYPTIAVDSALGVTAGAGFVHRDVFGQREQLTAQAAAGSRYRQIYAASFATGQRLGDRVSLRIDTGYERRPHDAFYGIGNGDTMPQPEAPIDPRIESASVEARYRQDRARASATVDVRVADRFHIRSSGALSTVRFGPGDEGAAINEIYTPSGLVGWEGASYGYGEIELRWDSRRSVTVMEPNAVHSAGALAAVFGGRAQRLDAGPDFWRYGLDLQKFVRVGSGPRVLSAHFHGEGVTGGRDEVPFTELPRLGGSTFLRGYALDRFRDRVAAFGSLAYTYDLSQWFSANVFTDVGRVFPSLSDLSVDHLRVGYGIGIEAHTLNSFLFEASIASSIDGGVMLNLSFNPVFDLDERVRRR